MSNLTNAKDKAERRRRKLIAMFADPTNAPTIQDAAKMLGVSAKTIGGDLKAVQADMAEAEDKLQEYQRRFKERLPIDERVRLYEEIARQDGNLFARFKALQRVDAIDGIVTEGERLRIPRDREPREPAPMFILPEGAHVQVTINQQNNVLQAPPEATEIERESESDEQS
jgi:hypothetical protein